MKKQFKKRTKRVTTRKRVKIERKVREHNRKLRKEEKKTKHKSKRRKDPGVPNSCPFKEQVLKEAQDHKLKKEEEREKKKEESKQKRQNEFDRNRSLQKLVQDAEDKAKDFENKEKTEGEEEHGRFKVIENSTQTFYKEFRKVVEAADVIIEVLDARDPLGSRCSQVEELVRSAGATKRLVLLLNKIDLVPKENVEKWLAYLRHELPAVAFKASTQKQGSKLGRICVNKNRLTEDLIQRTPCLGADTLMKLLGNYCRKKDIKTAITVGIVGFPNTGKSSVINSLKRSQACNVGSVPGMTRDMQAVKLDKHIQLLDSPGIVMKDEATDTQLVLRNCVKLEGLKDPITPVKAILKRCTKQQMMLLYNIPEYHSQDEFLTMIATRFGKFKKKGIPDVHGAAKKLLEDWNRGKIRYYTEPPERTASTVVSTRLVSALSKEFDIDALQEEEKADLQDLKNRELTDIKVDFDAEDEMTEEWVDASDEEISQDVVMEEEHGELENIVITSSNKKKKKVAKVELKKKEQEKSSIQKLKDNKQLNKARKMEFKKAKKDKRRATTKQEKAITGLSSALENL